MGRTDRIMASQVGCAGFDSHALRAKAKHKTDENYENGNMLNHS